MWIKLSFIWIYLLVERISLSDGACTFPDEIDGVWYSAHKGALTFNSTTITSYPIYMSVLVQSLDFVCEEQNGYKYLLKSTTTTLVFGSYIYAYLCIELRRVSPYKYYYYIGTTVEPTVNEHVYGRIVAITVTMSDACNRAEPYEESTFVTLIKDGSLGSELGDATCTSLLASYSSVVITDSTGSTSCSGSSVNGCSDRTELQYTYQACTSGLVFSSGGLFTCLRAATYNSYTYLSIWNNDSTVDGSSTYRFTCLSISSDGSSAYATEYPNYCSDASQTPTSVPSPGIILTMSSQTENCEQIKDGATYLMFIVIIIIGSILIIIGIVIYAICSYKKGCLCSRERCSCCSKTKDPQRMTSSYSNRSDTVSNTVFKINSLPPLCQKRTRLFGPVVEANMIKPLPKVESLYGAPRGRMMSSTSRTGSLGSLFSFKYKV